MSFSPSHVLTTRLCAAFALALGAMTLVGWALGNPQMVQIRPEWTPMVVNTAIGFLLSGAGLLAAIQRGRWTTRIAAMLGILVALLAAEELCVLIFDIAPALSLPELHRPLQPDYPHPGRMAPNTALCFLLFGAGLMALLRSHRSAITRWVQRAAITVLAIGSLGVIGYSLQLEYMYSWIGVAQMAVHTGVGMAVLGIGLWNLVRARAGEPPIFDGNEVSSVYRTATLLLLLVAASAGIGGFAFLQSQVEQQVHDDLLHMAVDRIVLFDQIIQDRSGRAKVVSDANDLAIRLRALVLAPHDPATLRALRAWAGRLRANGYSSVSAEAAGQHWQLDGEPTRPTLTVALHGNAPGWLLWQDGYVLRRALPVRDATGMVGKLVTEQPLQALTAISAATNRLGDTGEMMVCAAGAVANTMLCFPFRSSLQPSSFDRIVGGLPRPMDYPLRGKTGTVIAFDYRQQRVLAAYGPVGDTGLGLLVKRDIAEIYAPIRQQFQRIVIFLGTLLVIGLWLMRRRLRPLLHALEESRAQARADSMRFAAAVESNLDGFFILECMRDAAGQIYDLRNVLLNRHAEQMFDRPREELLGRGMCELIPIFRSDGFLDAGIRTVETGEPSHLERASVVRPDFWYEMRFVKLGDGLGLTVRDITAAKKAADVIRHQAMHDPLTDMANRAGFELALTAAIAQAQQHCQITAVVLLDLDDFKPINDSFGHAIGDMVLQETAARLRDCVRPSDTVARLGGDEFVLILPNIRYPDGAEIVARKLVAEIAQPMRVDGHELTVTISVGLSACPHDGLDVATLLSHADKAMYRAKRAGRNGYALYTAALDAVTGAPGDHRSAEPIPTTDA